MNKKLRALIDRYESTNRIAFIHRRSKTISFNGGREVNYKEAQRKLEEFFSECEEVKL